MSLDNFMHAIGTIESGNNYNAVGPQTGKMGRALGRWQIMSANWGPWSREAGLGSHADWRDPKNQEAVARFKMGQYWSRYKNWDLVAVAWFGGPGAANKAERNGISSLGGTADVLGTTVPSYVKKYRSVWDPDSSAPANPRQADLAQGVGSAGQSPRRPNPRQADGMSMPRALQSLTSARGGRTIAPIEAAPGTVLTEGQQATRDAQVNQDSLASILDTVSSAAKGNGGQILDLKGFLGMPDRETPLVGGIPEPTVNEAPQPAAQPENPRQADGPMAEPPDHPGFKGLTSGAQVGSQQLMGAFPGLRFTSGHRSEAANSAANGVKNSKHLTGQASDFVGSEEQMQAAAKWAKERGAKTLIHDSGSGRHLHIEWP